MTGRLIIERVRQARAGENPYVIAKLPSGWLVAGDVQPLPGYCLFLADPVVADLNALNDDGRAAYSLDVIRCGDAILHATGAERINYETWGNTEPHLHTHMMPRYSHEAPDKRRMPACMVYSWADAPAFNAERDAELFGRVRAYLDANGEGEVGLP